MHNPPFNNLTACLRHLPPVEKREFLQTIPAADWDEIFELAKHHGLAPNLFHALKPHKEALEMPEEIFAELQRIYFTAAARNTRLYGELERLLQGFNREKIPVGLLKGVHLAEAVYGNIALRSMADIDLLVKESDLEQADKLLLAQGAHPHVKTRIKAARGKHFNYTLPAQKLYLELHWDLINGKNNGIPPEILWSRLEALRVGSADVLVVKPEDLVPYLCLHLAEHLHDLRLRMIIDLDVVIRFFGEALDWKRTAAAIQQWHAETAAHVFLTLASRCFDTPVTPDIFARLAPKDIPEAAIDNLFEILKTPSQPFDSSRPTPGTTLWWNTKGIRAKTAFLIQRLSTFPNLISSYYGVPRGSWRQILYYPRCLADLCRHRIRPLWHLITGIRKTQSDAQRIYHLECLRRRLLNLE